MVAVVSLSYAQVDNSKEIKANLLALQKTTGGKTRVHALLNLSASFAGNDPFTKADHDSSFYYMDQAEKLSRTLKYDSGIVGSYLALINILQKTREGKVRGEQDVTREITLSKETEAKAIQLVKQEKDNVKLGKLYMTIGDLYVESEPNYQEKHTYYVKAQELFRAAGNKKEEARALLRTGKNIMDAGDLIQAEQYALASIKASQASGGEYLGEAYTLLANKYVLSGDYKLGLKNALKAEKIVEKTGTTPMKKAELLNIIGKSYHTTNNDALAAKYLEKALNTYASVPNIDISLIYTVIANIVKIKLITDPNAALSFLDEACSRFPIPSENNAGIYQISAFLYLEIFTKTQQYEKAKPYCKLLMRDIDLMPANSPNRFVMLGPVIGFLVANGEYAAAARYLPGYGQIAKEYGITSGVQDLHFWSFQIDTAKGNYKSALEHFYAYKTISDSMVNETKAKEIAQLQVEYETEKKDKDIQNLWSKGQLQESRLKQAAFTRNVTMGGIVLLTVILLLLYNQYRLKQRSNKNINRKNETLQLLVDEKEWLLKEIHHRVKNNLQTVVSLLESQSSYLKDDALIAIQDSQNRVFAMSLIHKKLYQEDNVAAIDIKAYIRELVNYLQDIMNVGQKIKFRLDVPSFDMDVSQAVPIGLILNEATTNAIKYAFPDKSKSCVIDISLYVDDERDITLTISDNGSGFTPGDQTSKSGGLGLRLMRGLAEDIAGKFDISSDRGTTITIHFTATVPLQKTAPMFADTLA